MLKLSLHTAFGVASFVSLSLHFLCFFVFLSFSVLWFLSFAGESISRANYLLFALMMFAGYIFATHLVTAVMYIGFKQSKEKREERNADSAASPLTSRRCSALLFGCCLVFLLFADLKIAFNSSNPILLLLCVVPEKWCSVCHA